MSLLFYWESCLITQKRLLIIAIIMGLSLGSTSWVEAQQESIITGTVKDEQGIPVPSAVVLLKELSQGTAADLEGRYLLKGNFEGTYTIEISSVGFIAQTHNLTLQFGDHQKLNVTLKETTHELTDVTVWGKSELQEVKEKAYNVDVIDAKKLHQTTLDIGSALDRVSGIRVRENGGVGSGMNLSLNGFTGKQVKIFIDGIPMENLGSSFQLNNIPISLAKRIEIYKGVVPVGLGADALGGAINIITDTDISNKVRFDASYAYGSFNTHRSTLNLGYETLSGFTMQLNAYQNYSDNNYWITTDVADINTGKYYPDQRLRRFHDTYHNETIIAAIGVVGKSYADKLLLGVTLGKNYKEIQTGARLVSVFGQWHRKGDIIMPSLKYKKDNLFIQGLNVTLNANYNLGTEQNIDTLHRRYNWFGEYKEYEGKGGERSYSMYEYKNNNGIATASIGYHLNEYHSLSLNHVFTTFSREGSDKLFPDQEKYKQPKKNIKHITGLGYQYEYQDRWTTAVFIKHYNQVNKFSQSYNPSGNWGDVAYLHQQNIFNKMGYGLATTYFINSQLQLKASYERSYRLPETNEIYGDLINLTGNIDLEPESSDNYNFGVSYWGNSTVKDHKYTIDGNVFYRYAKDFIRARLNNNQAMQVMDNLADVTNIGIEAEARFFYKESITAGINATYQELRNNNQFEEGQTTTSIVYRDRIPNMPYLFGNADASYVFNDLWRKNHDMSIGYNLLYVHAFYLYWPSLGSEKFDVSRQLSHDLSLTYTMGATHRLQFTIEARNLFDTKLYDNFSLQKPGRSFTGKIRYIL